MTINFDAILIEEFGETKAMSLFDLLAALGGSMGLFAGMSLISVAEIFFDFGITRCLPRCWGDRRLRGLGSVSYEAVPSIESSESKAALTQHEDDSGSQSGAPDSE